MLILRTVKRCRKRKMKLIAKTRFYFFSELSMVYLQNWESSRLESLLSYSKNLSIKVKILMMPGEI